MDKGECLTACRELNRVYLFVHSICITKAIYCDYRANTGNDDSTLDADVKNQQ